MNCLPKRIRNHRTLVIRYEDEWFLNWGSCYKVDTGDCAILDDTETKLIHTNPTVVKVSFKPLKMFDTLFPKGY